MIKVKKYGGSSLKNIDLLKKVARQIADDSKDNKQIVVVSAREGYTEEMIKLHKEASANTNNRELDQMIVTGEMINAALLATILNDLGLKTVSLNAFQLDIKTDNTYQDGRIISIDKNHIINLLNEYDVLVVTGYQGHYNNEFVSLGRGGSDTTAMAIASVLDVECLIYTDVDGVYTIDPKLGYQGSKLLDISHNDMLELSLAGGKVLAYKAALLASNYNINTKIIKSQTNEYTEIKDLETYGIKALQIEENVSLSSTGPYIWYIDDDKSIGASKSGNDVMITVVGSFLLHLEYDKKIKELFKGSVGIKGLLAKENSIALFVAKEDKERAIKLLIKEFKL